MKRRKLRQTYNSMHKMWVEYKEQRKEAMNIMSNRKAEDDEKRRRAKENL